MGYEDQTLSNVTRPVSVASGDNTDGAEVVLPAGGRPFVNLYYSVSGDATIAVEGRYILGDGTETGWISIDSIDTSQADTPAEDTAQYPWQSYDEIRVATNTTGIDVEFVISAGR